MFKAIYIFKPPQKHFSDARSGGRNLTLQIYITNKSAFTYLHTNDTAASV